MISEVVRSDRVIIGTSRITAMMEEVIRMEEVYMITGATGFLGCKVAKLLTAQ